MDLDKALKLIEETAGLAGSFIRKEFESFDRKNIEYKSANNLVSYVDKRAEQMIVENLLKFDTTIGFITEEDSIQKGDIEGYNWIIDPLDGTVNFVHGVPHFAISIALARGNDLLAGVVYHVITQEMYSAITGKGAFKNGNPIRVSSINKLSDSLISTGFPYQKFDYLAAYFGILEDLMQKTNGLRRFGAAALDLVHVADGRYECFFESHLNAWDLAAGALVVREAGGVVTDFGGGDQFLWNGNIIAAGGCFEELFQVIFQRWNPLQGNKEA